MYKLYMYPNGNGCTQCDGNGDYVTVLLDDASTLS